MFVLSILLTGIANALPASNTTQELNLTSALVGIAAITVGMLLIFFGYGLVYHTLFASGFLSTGFIGYCIMEAALPASSNKELFVLIVTAAIGLFGGFLAMWIFNLGLSMTGAITGVSFAIFLFSWNEDMFPHSYDKYIFISVFGLVGCFAIHFFKLTVLIVVTAFLGSYIFILGVDEFVGTGITHAFNDLIQNSSNSSDYAKDSRIYFMLGSLMVIAAVGASFQFRMHSRQSTYLVSHKS